MSNSLRFVIQTHAASHWDRGYWDCEDHAQSYAKGKLDFTFEKLRGGWILTRMRKREGEKLTNWLLIKHRDEFAREGKKKSHLGRGYVGSLGPIDG